VNKLLTERARKVLALADVEARSLDHRYIGTEHLLLGLIAEESGAASDVLRSLGVDAGRIRAEIERIIQRGAEPDAECQLLLTPRAKRVIEYARDEAQSVGQKATDAEHLLIALLREPDGVAGEVLRNLGIKTPELRAEALRVRIQLMKIVERSVRPVRAGAPRKRKMREELLAHLAAIYDEELARRGEPRAAFEAAEQRFGEPVELAREFEAALPFHERINYFAERFVAYRAPESAVRYSLRMALHTFALLATSLGVLTFGLALGYGWTEAVKMAARILGAIVLLTPPAQFMVWLAYIKMRDAMWGAFGSRKSLARVFALDLLIAAVIALFLLGVATAAPQDPRAAIALCAVIGSVSGVAFLLMAYFGGPNGIRDTRWALLDIELA
jgi:Clp amino terminal domain, pathogenicity island component